MSCTNRVGRRDDFDAALADDVAAIAAGDAAELGIHVLVDEIGIEQRNAARSQFEHGAETRIGRAPHDVSLAREQQGAHRGDEHGRIDRVREIAVTAGGQALLVIVVSNEGRCQVHDGKKCRVAARAQPATHFQPIDVWQIDVEHDERRLRARRRRAHPCPSSLRSLQIRRIAGFARWNKVTRDCRRPPGSSGW